MNGLPCAERQEHVSPAIRLIALRTDDDICKSRKKGNNEDVGYDDWWND